MDHTAGTAASPQHLDTLQSAAHALLTSHTHVRAPDSTAIVEAAADLLRNPLMRAIRDDSVKEKFLRAAGLTMIDRVFSLAREDNTRVARYSRSTPAQRLFKHTALILLALSGSALAALLLFRTLYVDRVTRYALNFSRPILAETAVPSLQKQHTQLLSLHDTTLPATVGVLNTLAVATTSLQSIATLISRFSQQNTSSTAAVPNSYTLGQNNVGDNDNQPQNSEQKVPSSNDAIASSSTHQPEFDLDAALHVLERGEPLAPAVGINSTLTDDEKKLLGRDSETNALYDPGQFASPNDPFNDSFGTNETNESNGEDYGSDDELRGTDALQNDGYNIYGGQDYQSSNGDHPENPEAKSAEKAIAAKKSQKRAERTMDKLMNSLSETKNDNNEDPYLMLCESTDSLKRFLLSNLYSTPLLQSMYTSGLPGAGFNSDLKYQNGFSNPFSPSASNGNDLSSDMDNGLSPQALEWLRNMSSLKSEIRDLKGLVLKLKARRTKVF